MKKLFDIYEYLYYRTFIWQKRLHGEKWAMFSAVFLPMILFWVHFILPIILLLDLYICSLNDKTVARFSFVFVIFISIYYENRHHFIINKYQRTNICNKIYMKRLLIFIITTVMWIIITFIVYQMLRPDEIQNSYPSDEVIEQLRNIRNSNIE